MGKFIKYNLTKDNMAESATTVLAVHGSKIRVSHLGVLPQLSSRERGKPSTGEHTTYVSFTTGPPLHQISQGKLKHKPTKLNAKLDKEWWRRHAVKWRMICPVHLPYKNSMYPWGERNINRQQPMAQFC